MRRRAAGAAVLLALGAALPALSEVKNSRHNLAVGGPGSNTAAMESKICIFCHTSHTGNPALPLWNHELSTVTHYATYSSSTLTIPGPLEQPTGVSKLCLSCHDGTVGLGKTGIRGPIQMHGPGRGRMPKGEANLGTDLTDDHPISFVPNLSNPEILNPPPGDPVQLDETGRVQCTTCHDPHQEDRDPVTRKFLVTENRASQMCTTCHRMAAWDSNPSSHQSSNATYAELQGAHTGYTTVRDNGCESCHKPHTGNTPQRLIKFPEEATCDPCHDGSVAARDVAADFRKPFVHPTYSMTPSVHDAAEAPNGFSYPLPEIDPGASRHAECSDCHNPHASFTTVASSAGVPGSLAGTWGIDATGAPAEPAVAEFQICFKCHGDSANKPQSSGLPDPPYTRRRLEQFNTRLEFDPQNPSHHAVVGPGRNPDVPSLLQPYTAGSVIRCTDCHSSDSGPGAGGHGPGGPHGSIHNHILERNLNTGDDNAGIDFGSMYALCFKCHSEASIMGDRSFSAHRLHIDGENSSCLVCHDPHGISSRQGNDINNSHLINFDAFVVQPNVDGLLEFVDYGTYSGGCALNCHGVEHDPARGTGTY
jgi:predicted CXXCH cytochrome family protein